MYNQIWSPLKQEFVPTLSKHGRQALKMYVNSFMTGGAIKQEDIPIINATATAVDKLKDNINDENQNAAANALKILGETLEVKAPTDNIEGEPKETQEAAAKAEVDKRLLASIMEDHALQIDVTPEPDEVDNIIRDTEIKNSVSDTVSNESTPPTLNPNQVQKLE
jgi:hypothetical protein